MSTQAHKSKAPKHVAIGIVTISTTRTLATDKTGLWIKKRAQKEGHRVIFHQVVDDDSEKIVQTVLDVIRHPPPQALLLTGGTGISARDVTIEAVRPLFDKELTAFGPIFSQLSFEEIDSAAIMSRATAGIIDETVVFCMPGSLAAVKLACTSLIFPELGHLVKHLVDG